MDDSRSSTLSKEQKVGFSLLLVFGISAVGLGFLQMRNTLYGPFAYKPPETPAITTEDATQQEILRQQALDTDQDGINNFEELNFFGTSPYLDDTDSDGIKDKAEIDAGKDPLCPEGVVCASGDETPTVSSTFVGESVESTITAGTILQQVNTSVSQGKDADIETLIQDPQSIREMIRQTGKVSEQDLAKITDEQLLLFAQEILNKQVTPEEEEESLE